MQLQLTKEQWDRFMSNTKEDERGCWVWQRARQANGYGRVGLRTTTHNYDWVAHRLSWTHLRGPIPDGLVIDHLCRNRACVNPDHLEPVTQKVNVNRGNVVGIKKPCPESHVRATNKNGYGYCRTCNLDAQRRWREMKKREETA